VNCW